MAKLTQKIISIGVFCIFFSAIFFSKAIYDEYQLAKTLCFIFFALLIFALLLFSKKKPRVNFVFFIFAVFFLYVVLQVFASMLHPQFYYIIALLSPVAFIIPLFVEIDRKKFLLFMNALLFLSSLYGIWQFFYVAPRPYSFFGNPIFFGEFMMMNFPFAVISFFLFEKNKPAFLLNAALALVSILLASSRGVFISLAVSLCFLLFLLMAAGVLVLRKKPAFIYFVCFLLLAAVLLVIPRFSSMLKSDISRGAELFSVNNQSVKNRVLMLKTAALMARENPVFGLGAGSFKYLYQKYQAETMNKSKNYDFVNTSYAHNDYAQMLVEFGTAGLLLFLAFVFSLVFYYEKASYLLGPDDYIFSFALLASITGTLVESFFNFPLFILPSSVLFWLYGGFLYSLIISNDKESIKINARVYKPALAVIILAVIIVFFTKPFDFISNFYLKYGAAGGKIAYSHNGTFKTAVKYDPDNYYTHVCLAGSYAAINKLDEAAAEYEKALVLNPYAADLLYDTAVIYKEKSDFDRAQKYLEKSIMLFPDFAQARLALGQVFVAVNRQQEAAEEFDAVQRISPDIMGKISEKNLVLFEEATW